jgi:hypothetical protein
VPKPLESCLVDHPVIIVVKWDIWEKIVEGQCLMHYEQSGLGIISTATVLVIKVPLVLLGVSKDRIEEDIWRMNVMEVTTREEEEFWDTTMQVDLMHLPLAVD